MIDINYNPDVLSCLANLSNDEVFTPPLLVNDILDTLPVDLWFDPTATFLDPVSKSGVFLREIAIRLIWGLEEDIPDLDERINHILTKQLFGIAITDLTASITRRSVYCSRLANGKYSICSDFNDDKGNIHYERAEHIWDKKKCIYCGGAKSVYDRDITLENHAYQFIHTKNPEELFNMRFDVIIGNPPYQLSDGGNNASATPIYNLFVEQAKKMRPRFLSMIIPARWYCGGRGLASFRNSMLEDRRLREIHDFKNTADCFPRIRVGGGICYFLWDSHYDSELINVHTHTQGEITNTTIRPKLENGLNIFIRDSIVSLIIQKIALLAENKMTDIVFSQKPYGLRTNFMDFKTKGDFKLYTKKTTKGFAYISGDKITKNLESIKQWKVVTSRSTSVPEEDNGQVLRMSQTFLVEPNAVVTESYVVVGSFDTEQEAINCMTYVKTRFFRLLCQVTIVSPDVSPRTFSLIPLQNFSESWNDEKLFKKYDISDEEILYIKSIIRPMESNNE